MTTFHVNKDRIPFFMYSFKFWLNQKLNQKLDDSRPKLVDRPSKYLSTENICVCLCFVYCLYSWPTRKKDWEVKESSRR